MFSLKEIPEVPQTVNIIYANPYKKPQYCLNEFDINFGDYHSVSMKEKLLSKKQELENKILKIKELNMLKSIEKENLEKYDTTISQLKNGILEDSERKKDIKNINKLIGNFENCIADLTRYFLNFNSSRQDSLFNRLNDLMYENDLKLTGENENSRSELLSSELSSLKNDSYKKSKSKAKE